MDSRGRQRRPIPPLSDDARRVIAAQALRGIAYGMGSVLLGTTLDTLRFSATEAGLVLGAVVAGTVVASIAIGRWADSWGRRRCYVALYVLLAVTGAVFAFSSKAWVLALVALCGALSTEVVESGPFTSLEQTMLVGGVAAASVSLGAPFVIAGAIKVGYDLVLWRWFSRVPLPAEFSPEA